MKSYMQLLEHIETQKRGHFYVVNDLQAIHDNLKLKPLLIKEEDKAILKESYKQLSENLLQYDIFYENVKSTLGDDNQHSQRVLLERNFKEFEIKNIALLKKYSESVIDLKSDYDRSLTIMTQIPERAASMLLTYQQNSLIDDFNLPRN